MFLTASAYHGTNARSPYVARLTSFVFDVDLSYPIAAARPLGAHDHANRASSGSPVCQSGDGAAILSAVTDTKRAGARPLSHRVDRLGVAAISFGAIFVIIALAYRAGMTKELDHATFVLFARIDDTTLDAIAEADDGLARVIPTFAAAAVLSLILAWKGPRWAWIVPLFIGFTGIVEFFAKLGFGRGLHLGEILTAAREFLGVRFHTGGSFPSGHVARSAFLAAVAVRLFPSWIAVPLVAFAALTFVARLYIEAHRLSDVFGGVALGVSIACTGLWLRAILESRSARRAAVGDPDRSA